MNRRLLFRTPLWLRPRTIRSVTNERKVTEPQQACEGPVAEPAAYSGTLWISGGVRSERPPNQLPVRRQEASVCLKWLGGPPFSTNPPFPFSPPYSEPQGSLYFFVAAWATLFSRSADRSVASEAARRTARSAQVFRFCDSRGRSAVFARRKSAFRRSGRQFVARKRDQIRL